MADGLVRLDPFIDGEPRAAADEMPLFDPSTGEQIGSAARCGDVLVDEAVQAAHRARREWRDTHALDRGRILVALAAAIRANGDELAEAERISAAKLPGPAERDVETAAQYFEYYGGLAPGLEGSKLGDRADAFSIVAREPYGVTGHIIPWNFPLHTAARSIAPALAAGNTVVAKPAEQTPQSCLILARLASEVGVPSGVFNVVTGYGTEAGAALTAHPLVRRLTFTGSVATGRIVLHAAAERLCPATVELGGKSPVLVFDDADLDAAANDAATAILAHSGQICSAGSRLLVAEPLHDAIVDRLRERFDATSVGPADAGADIGPVVDDEQARKIRAFVATAQDEGARLVTDDDPGEGRFVRPALFTGVTRDMTIAREEVFGPVLAVSSFASIDDAIELANSSSYGLAAGIWTRDITRALATARELEVGTVYINGYYAGGVDLPFGGYKDSGFGREKGRLALEEYTQIKSINVALPRG